jgi:transcriptional regulator with XRE-family HTH domain
MCPVAEARRKVDPIVLRLREIRQERGLSQRQVAEKAGVHHRTIGYAETGRFGVSLQVLRLWAKALDVSLVTRVMRAPRRRGIRQVLGDLQ